MTRTSWRPSLANTIALVLLFLVVGAWIFWAHARTDEVRAYQLSKAAFRTSTQTELVTRPEHSLPFLQVDVPGPTYSHAVELNGRFVSGKRSAWIFMLPPAPGENTWIEYQGKRWPARSHPQASSSEPPAPQLVYFGELHLDAKDKKFIIGGTHPPHSAPQQFGLMAFTYAPAGILVAMLLGLWLLNLFMRFAFTLNLPARVRDILETYQHFRDSRDTRSLALVLTYNLSAVFVVLAGLVVMGGQLQVHAGGEPMFALQFFLIPLVLISSMLPLTPMGIGVAQISMAGAYELFGLSSSVGVSVSTLSQLGLLMVSLVAGGTCFLLSKAELSQADTRAV